MVKDVEWTQRGKRGGGGMRERLDADDQERPPHQDDVLPYCRHTGHGSVLAHGLGFERIELQQYLEKGG